MSGTLTASSNGVPGPLRAAELRLELETETDTARRIRLAEQIDRAEGRDDYMPKPPPTTWAPVPLDEILAGDYKPATPTMLARIDGRCLLYPERSHSVSAEPEALKTWLALGACAEQLAAGNIVVYIDFEGSAAEIVGRLRSLGTDPEVIRQRFIYLRPDEPLAERSLADLDAALGRKPTLTVVDGVTEAFNLQGLNPLDNGDVATWLDLLPRRIIRAGSAPLMLDHVVKDKDQRGRYAIGAQHKLAGVDVHYSMHVVEPFGRGHNGVVTIKVQKDRPGGIREYADDGIVATLRATSHTDGRVSIRLEPPERTTSEATGELRPTHLMEAVSRYLEQQEDGATVNAVKDNVTGKGPWKATALRTLVAEGYVEKRIEGQAHVHHSLRPYRQTDDQFPESQPSPNRFPDPVRGTGSPSPSPIGDSEPGLGTPEPATESQDPDQARAEALFARHRGATAA